MPTASWPSRIRALRAALRVSQVGLAGLIGVDQATVSRWLSGGPEPPSGVTAHVVEALERIVAHQRVEAMFASIRARRLRPRTREMLEVIFAHSTDKEHAR